MAGDASEAAEPQEIPELPAHGREHLATALVASSAALASDDREQLARALTSLADAARAVAAAIARADGRG
jgi:hypothetical protein